MERIHILRVLQYIQKKWNRWFIIGLIFFCLFSSLLAVYVVDYMNKAYILFKQIMWQEEHKGKEREP